MRRDYVLFSRPFDFVGGVTLPMKRFTSTVAALGIVLTALSTARAQLYWDVNLDGGTGGNGTATPSGTWDNGTTANWNINSDGTGAPGFWTPDSLAVFAAGNDA